MREEVAAQVGEHALADPGREVGLGDRGDPAEQRGDHEAAVQKTSAWRSPGTMPRSIANLEANGETSPIAVPKIA